MTTSSYSFNPYAMKHFFILIACCGWLIASAQNIPLLGLAVDHVNPVEKVYNLYAKDYDRMLVLQYSMVYDPARMAYRGIRGGVLLGYDESCVGNPFAGSVTSVWLDLPLIGQYNPDSTILIQFVFDIIQPGGSSLCFSENPLGYEFMKGDLDTYVELNQIQLHDECFTGIVDIDNATGISQPQPNMISLIDNVTLSISGELNFTSIQNQQLIFSLTDMLGREIRSGIQYDCSKGPSAIHLGQPLSNAIYLIKTVDQSGQFQAIKVFAK
jgi:hypothetical protein